MTPFENMKGSTQRPSWLNPNWVGGILGTVDNPIVGTPGSPTPVQPSIPMSTLPGTKNLPKYLERPGTNSPSSAPAQQYTAPDRAAMPNYTPENYLSQLTNVMRSMQSAQLNDKRAGQQAAQQQARQAATLNKQIGSQLDAASAEAKAAWQTGGAMLQQYLNDPLMSRLSQIAMDRAENPGFSQDTINKIKSNASAKNAANANATTQSAQWAMAGRGTRGAAKSTLLAALKNDAAARSERTQSGIDIAAAQAGLNDRNSALNFAGSVQGQKSALAQAFANHQMRYQPLSQIQMMANLQAPMQQIGYNTGRLG